MLKAAVLGLALVAGAIATLAGIVVIGWPQQPWTEVTELGRFILYLLAFAAATQALATWRQWSHATAALAVAGCFAFAAAEWRALIFIPLFVLASLAVGRYLTRCWTRKPLVDDDLLLDFLLGAGLYATLIGLLAHLPLAHPAFYAVLLLAPFAPRPRLVPELAGALLEELRKVQPPSGRHVEWLAICALALMHFGVAFLPEVGHDALGMHLFVPGFVEAQREWSFDPNLYGWGLMPMLGDWLYTLLYVLGGETAARLVNTLFILVLALFTRRFACWMGAGPRAAPWAMLLYLSMPLTFGESSSLFIDSIWASFVLAACWWLLQAADGRRHMLLAGGLFLGFALQAKLGTTTLFPLVLLCLIYAARQAPGLLRGSGFVWFLVPVLAMGCIPYLRAWLIAGNPVFPFFNAFFQSPYYPAENFASSFPGFLSWNLPWLITFDANRFMDGTAGAPGFQWLILLPAAVLAALFARKRRALVLLAGCLAAIASTFLAQSYLRYVFPALPPLCALLALLVEDHRRIVRRLAFAAAGVTVAANLAFFPAATWNYRRLPLAPIFSAQARTDYLDEQTPMRNLVPLINALNQERLPVAFLAESIAVAGLQSDVLFASWYNQRFFDALAAAYESREAIAQVFYDYGAQLVVLDEDMRRSSFKNRVHSISEQIAVSGNYSLLRILPAYRYGPELLENTALEGSEGWELTGGAYYDAGSDALVVSVPGPASQEVAVRPGRQYLLSLRASCIEAGVQGRLQVNWHDAEGSFIATAIRLFDCEERPAAQELMVQSPPHAAAARVFLSSHEDRPIRVHSASLR